MKNVPLLLGTIIGTVAMVVVVAVIFSKPVTPQVIDQTILMNTARWTKGPENAKVTIVEFSDLQCPACRAAQPAVKEVLEKYPQDVRLVFRHFPLVTIHQHAQQAAVAAEAAGALGKFWEFHDQLFDTQDVWSQYDQKQVTETFAAAAEKLQIDKTAFQQKIESSATQEAVATDVGDATKAGVNATPTFFVNGVQTSAPDLLKTVTAALQQQ